MMAPNIYEVDQARRNIANALKQAAMTIGAAVSLANETESEHLDDPILLATKVMEECDSIAASIDEGII